MRELFDKFPKTRYNGTNAGLDWCITKIKEFQTVVNAIPETVRNILSSGNFDIETDKTLTLDSRAADAKAVGDAIKDVKDSIPGIDTTLKVSGKAADAKTVGDALSKIPTGGGYTIDPTLTNSGEAADAKAVGDAIKDVEDSIPGIDTTLKVSGKAADAKAVGTKIDSVMDSIPGIDSLLETAGFAADAKAVGDFIKRVDYKTNLGTVDGEESFNTAISSFFSTLTNGTVNSCQFVEYSYRWFGIVAKTSNEYGVVIAYSPYYRGTIRIKNISGGSWDIWRWLNPPGLLGVEYATAEKIRGWTKYYKVVDFGSGPNNTTKTVAHGITGTPIIVNFGGYKFRSSNNSALSLPWLNFSSVCIDSTEIKITSTADYSAYNIYVWIEYYKL